MSEKKRWFVDGMEVDLIISDDLEGGIALDDIEVDGYPVGVSQSTWDQVVYEINNVN